MNRRRLLWSLVLTALAIALVGAFASNRTSSARAMGSSTALTSDRQMALDMIKNRITPAERQQAAINAAKAAHIGTATRKAATARKALSPSRAAAMAAAAMNPLGTPDYFGMTPNWANTQLPASIGITGDGMGAILQPTVDALTGAITGATVVAGGTGYTAANTAATVIGGGGSGALIAPTIDVTTGAITGITVNAQGTGYNTMPGLRKFIDTLPGLSADHGATGANDLGQYVPLAVADKTTYPGSDYYEIGLVQYQQQLHKDLAPTTLRGYVQLETPANAATSLHYPLVNVSVTGVSTPVLDSHGNRVFGYDKPQYLGPTILANRDVPVRVKFTNYLPTGAGGDLFIPVDRTEMGAGMGPKGTDYSENRATIHLHGGITPWISDGTPHQWTTPAGETTDYPKGVSVQNVPDMPAPGPGSLTFYYTNQQSARLMFYHDHTYGITRLNVYAGEAGPYLVQDPVEQDFVNGTDTTGANPTKLAAIPKDQIPLVIQDKTFVPDTNQLAAEDPTWDTANWGGQNNLWFPHVYMPNQNPYVNSGANMMGRWDYGPWFWPPMTQGTGGLVNGPVANPLYTGAAGSTENQVNPGTPNPSIVPEAFMDTMLVNGTAYPYTVVQPKQYRLRILNASNDRMLNLQLYLAKSNATMWKSNGTLNDANAGEVSMVPAIAGTPQTAGYPHDITDGRDGGVPDVTTKGPQMIQIGTEGGLLPNPVVLNNTPVGYNYNRRDIVVLNVTTKNLFLGPAERGDVVVDFSGYAPGTRIVLYNDAPAPVPAFDPRLDYYTGDPDQTSTGGAPSTQPGYGPNTRTIMEFVVGSGPAQPDPNLLTNLQTAIPEAFAASQDPPPVPESAYNNAYKANYTDAFSRIQSTSLTFTPAGAQQVNSIDVTTPGAGYTSAPTVVIDPPTGTTNPVRATAHATIDGTGAVTGVVVDNPGFGYLTLPNVSFSGGGTPTTAATASASFALVKGMEPKAIQELFEVQYGRMNATLGVELPFTNFNIQTTIPLGYVDPITESLRSTDKATPIGALSDGTQIWKITHNGVDTHAIHFHLFNVEVINRVGWDGAIRPPDPNEEGWKDTVRMNPLEDCIVAMRPIAPAEPWGQMNSVRSPDVTQPASATITVTNPADGNPLQESNAPIDFGWEYVWHCHLLGHEENDMMRPMQFIVPSTKPNASTLTGGARSAGSTTSLNNIALSWTDPTPWNGTGPASTLGNPRNEVGYRIQRAVDTNGTPGAWSQIGTALANATSYTDATAGSQTVYDYRVVAYNQAGQTVSNVLLAALTVPAAPTNLTGVLQARTPSGGPNGVQVRLTWVDAATNEAAFIVQRSPNNTTWSTVTGTVPASAGTGGTVTYTDTTITANSTATNYYYRVMATNAVGNSTPPTGPTLVSVPALPATPSGLAGVVQTGASGPTVALSFTDNATNETGFTLQRQVNGGAWAARATLVVHAGTGIVTYTDTTTAPGTSYAYRVRADNGPIVNSLWNTSAAVVTPALPAAVNLTGTLIAGPTASLTWTGGGGATSFLVDRAPGGTTTWTTVATLASSARSYSNTPLTPGASYVYRVRAADVSGATASNSVTIAVPAIPAVPTGVSAVLSTGPRITVSWTENSNQTAFVLQRSVNGGAFATVASPTATTRSYADTVVVAGSNYRYRIAALNLGGTSAYAQSSLVAIPLPPAAPSGLTRTITRTAAGPDTVVLRWTDNSANETGFTVQRATNAAFSAGLTNFNVGANVVTLTQTVAHGDTYFYRVLALNLGGSSAWSSTVNATTVPAVPTNFRMTARTRSSITLGWNDVSTNETGYMIQRHRVGVTTWTTVTTTAANAISYVNSGRNPGTSYVYRIRGVNGVGSSPWSASITVATLP